MLLFPLACRLVSTNEELNQPAAGCEPANKSAEGRQLKLSSEVNRNPSLRLLARCVSASLASSHFQSHCFVRSLRCWRAQSSPEFLRATELNWAALASHRAHLHSGRRLATVKTTIVSSRSLLDCFSDGGRTTSHIGGAHLNGNSVGRAGKRASKTGRPALSLSSSTVLHSANEAESVRSLLAINLCASR